MRWLDPADVRAVAFIDFQQERSTGVVCIVLTTTNGLRGYPTVSDRVGDECRPPDRQTATRRPPVRRQADGWLRNSLARISYYGCCLPTASLTETDYVIA
jgi:hypothetical protein